MTLIKCVDVEVTRVYSTAFRNRIRKQKAERKAESIASTGPLGRAGQTCFSPSLFPFLHFTRRERMSFLVFHFSFLRFFTKIPSLA
jgi:hypothetical protein